MFSRNFKQDQLLKRLSEFAINCAALVKSLSQTEENRIYGRQLIRSSSSIGANYIEATGGASRKDFINGANIARKEAKESLYWLTLINSVNSGLEKGIEKLVDESEQIVKIFTSMVKTARSR